MERAAVSRRTAVALLILCTIAAGLSGCATSGSVTKTPSVAPAAAAIEPMTPSEKRSAIATSFPAEVPVPIGLLSRAQAQGDSGWDYEVAVAAAPEAVATWYREAYVGRQWLLVKQGEFDSEKGGGTFLEFRKGNASSRVDVFGDAVDGRTRAAVVVGVGTEVLETQ